MSIMNLDADRWAGGGDDFYADLTAAHDGLTDEASARLNLRLVLVLANAVGDLETLRAAIAIARGGEETPTPPAA